MPMRSVHTFDAFDAYEPNDFSIESENIDPVDELPTVEDMVLVIRALWTLEVVVYC